MVSKYGALTSNPSEKDNALVETIVHHSCSQLTQEELPVQTALSDNPEYMNAAISLQQKKECFTKDVQRTPSSGNRKKKRQKAEKKEGQASGRWSAEEHQAFLEGLKMYGREWKKVAEKISTRTSAQIRSHAQKYFSKLSKEEVQAQMMSVNFAAANTVVGSLNYQKSSHLSSAALEKIEKIMNDPSEVEKEVENTLIALHEKYRNLQLRLESRLTKLSSNGNQFISLTPAESNTIAVTMTGPASEALQSMSYMSSEQSSHVSTSREFGSEELIALHVLGSSLKMPISSRSHVHPANIVSPQSHISVESLDSNRRMKRRIDDLHNISDSD